MVAKGILWQAVSIQETSKRCTGALPGPHLGSFWTQNALKPHTRLCALRPCPVSCSSLAATHTLARVARVPCLTLLGVGQCRPEKTGYLRDRPPQQYAVFLQQLPGIIVLLDLHCALPGWDPPAALCCKAITCAHPHTQVPIDTLQRAAGKAAGCLSKRRAACQRKEEPSVGSWLQTQRGTLGPSLHNRARVRQQRLLLPPRVQRWCLLG